MDIHVYEISSQNAINGIWTNNTHNIRAGMCRQIILCSVNSTTTFNFKLIDDDSNVVYDTIRRGRTATFVLDDEIDLPMHGIYTARIYNASSDDTFTGRLLIED